MSHLTMVRTEFKDREILKEVIKKVSLEFREGGIIRQGQQRTEADFIVKGPNGSAIGFSWNAKERAFDAHVTGNTHKSFLDAIRTAYAREKVLKEGRRRGFVLHQEEKLEGKGIRLVLKKVV
ncbi:MAG: DUF1257 domain-containing protein [Proteobacteria bacterium]|nr:DUF1257 domain-containing protein [Pseudomonadota bacterium]NIS69669.1 DUF1257 domain-containing protein [Pseudomonadota bacterium]